MIGLFQVKYNFKDKASLDLIRASAARLMYELNSRFLFYTVSMNLPGIGYGGLEYDSVFPIISEIFDDRISVYVYGD
jgi:hypothetical protein